MVYRISFDRGKFRTHTKRTFKTKARAKQQIRKDLIALKGRNPRPIKVK